MRARLNRITAALSAAGAFLTLAGALLLSAAIPAQATAPRLQILKGGVLPGLTGARNLGALAANKKVLVAITVQKNLGALYRAEWAMYNPRSATYHRFLTPSAFQRRYGTPPARVAAIRAFGTAHGLRLVDPNRLYDYVELWGSVRQVETTFHVQLDSFRDAAGQRFFANLESPEVPSGLGIAAVLGLETFDHYHLADVHASDAGTLLTAQEKQLLAKVHVAGPRTPEDTTPGANSSQGQCESDPTGTVPSTCTGLLSPQALWKAYDMPTDDLGQGQTIGIIGEGQTGDVIGALREYEKTRDLPQVPVQVYHTDPGESAAESSLDDSGRIEWEMDTQSSTGMAPDVSQVRMYFGSSLALTELTGAIGTWVNDPDGPLQVSASLGACEDTPAEDILLGAAQRADQLFLAQAAMEGRTLFASAGDTGTGCAPIGTIAVNGVSYDPYPGQEYPAIDPNATAVGGTILYTEPNGSRALERAWDHTGGGPSKFIEQPAYQAGASPYLESNACPGIDGGGNPFPDGGHLCRGDVDVAAESGDVTIVTDHKVGDFDVAGGYDPTSAPIQANGFDMVDFCPQSEVSSEEPAEPDCGYDANGAGQDETVQTDDGPEQGYMTDNFSEGGTSLSSPLWLGMWARVQAHHDAGNAPGGSLGLANELIYPLAQGKTKAGSKTTRDFNNIEIGANPLPAGPGWSFPSGWGSPDLTYLIEDASGSDSTAPVSDVTPSGSDPPAVVAGVPSAPSCTYGFYEGNPNAPDSVTGDDDENLALVQGTLGLTPDHKDLRVVMNLQNLSTTVPQGFTSMDYEFYWTNPASDASHPDAVDVEVDSLGDITYEDGTESVTSAGGESSYSFSPSSTSDATGTFGSGPGGAVEVDVPLTELGLSVGDVVTGQSAWTAEDEGTAGNELTGFIVDQAGPGNNYTLGEPTCVDPEGSSGPSAAGPSGPTGPSGPSGAGGSSPGSAGTQPSSQRPSSAPKKHSVVAKAKPKRKAKPKKKHKKRVTRRTARKRRVVKKRSRARR